MKKISIYVLFALFSVIALAQENVFDLSIAEKEISDYGIPTPESVDKIGIEANKLFEEEKWEDAILAYELYSKNSNWLANLISKAVKPYYDASYDDRKSISSSMINALIKYESKSNYYKAERNKAIFRQGVCYYKLGDYQKSLPLILKTLDLISMDEKEIWAEARSILDSIIKFNE